jgi:hypothetical protein
VKCPLFRGHGRGSCRRGHEALQCSRRGADDEGTRSDFAGDGEEAEVDYRDLGALDAALAGALRAARLRGVIGPPRWQAHSPKRVPLATAEEVLRLYHEKYRISTCVTSTRNWERSRGVWDLRGTSASYLFSLGGGREGLGPVAIPCWIGLFLLLNRVAFSASLFASALRPRRLKRPANWAGNAAS